MTDIEKYYDICDAILACFDTVKHGKYVLTHGGCFWFANKIHEHIPSSYIVLNRGMQHCAVMIDNSVYDATGSICKQNFVLASAKDIEYMQKNFKPNIDLDIFISERGCVL